MKANAHFDRPLPRESAKAFAAFLIFRDSGTDRSTRKAAVVVKKHHTLLARWSKRFAWLERARAFDAHLERVTAAAEEKRLVKSSGRWAERFEEARERDFAIAEKLRTKAEQILQRADEGSLADATRAASTAAQLTRQACGLDGADGQVLPVQAVQVQIYLPSNGREASPPLAPVPESKG